MRVRAAVMECGTVWAVVVCMDGLKNVVVLMSNSGPSSNFRLQAGPEGTRDSDRDGVFNDGEVIHAGDGPLFSEGLHYQLCRR